MSAKLKVSVDVNHLRINSLFNSDRKLDLTLNFLDVEDLEESMNNLSDCYEMKDLYLTGNPC